MIANPIVGMRVKLTNEGLQNIGGLHSENDIADQTEHGYIISYVEEMPDFYIVFIEGTDDGYMTDNQSIVPFETKELNNND